MNFKRGIFCGVIAMIGSLDGLYEMYRMKNLAACGLYMLVLFLGITQIFASMGYEKPVKKRILLLCFGIEGIYCVAVVICLLAGNAVLGEKIFGMIVAIVYFSLILPSIYTLYHALSGIRKVML